MDAGEPRERTIRLLKHACGSRARPVCPFRARSAVATRDGATQGEENAEKRLRHRGPQSAGGLDGSPVMVVPLNSSWPAAVRSCERIPRPGTRATRALCLSVVLFPPTPVCCLHLTELVLEAFWALSASGPAQASVTTPIGGWLVVSPTRHLMLPRDVNNPPRCADGLGSVGWPRADKDDFTCRRCAHCVVRSTCSANRMAGHILEWLCLCPTLPASKTWYFTSVSSTASIAAAS